MHSSSAFLTSVLAAVATSSPAPLVARQDPDDARIDLCNANTCSPVRLDPLDSVDTSVLFERLAAGVYRICLLNDCTGCRRMPYLWGNLVGIS